MNLQSGWEDDPSMFKYMTGAGCGLMVGILAIGWFRLIKARRSQLLLRGTNHQQTPRPSRMLAETVHSTLHDGVAKDVSAPPSLQPTGEQPGTKKNGTEL